MEKDFAYYLEKIDFSLLKFFQHLSSRIERSGISLQLLINIVMLVVIISQSMHILFLLLAGKDATSTVLLAFPALLLTLFFYRAVKSTTKKIPLNLNTIRVLSFLFTLMTFITFTGELVHVVHSGIKTETELFSFRARIMYTITYSAFPCFLYFLSVVKESPIPKNKRISQQS